MQESSSLPSTPAFFSQQGMPLPGFGNLHSCGSLDVEDFRAAQRLPTPRSPAAPRTLEAAQASGRGGEWLLAALPGLAYCGGAAPALPRREPGAVGCLRHRARPPRPARPSACRRVSTARQCGCSPRCLKLASGRDAAPEGHNTAAQRSSHNSTNPWHLCLALAALPGLALCCGATLGLLVLYLLLVQTSSCGAAVKQVNQAPPQSYGTKCRKCHHGTTLRVSSLYQLPQARSCRTGAQVMA